MKVDTRPFPDVNMVEGHRDSGERSAQRRLDFSFDVNMAGAPRHCKEEKGASPCDQPEKVKRSTSPKNRSDTCGISGLSPRIYSRNINISIGSVASMNQKMKNMNTVLGRD
jgi:hypothetical protein